MYFLSIWLLLTILRETGVLTLNYYRSSISSNSSSTWSGRQMHTDLDIKDELSKEADSCANFPLADRPVSVTGEGMNYGDETGACPFIHIQVSGFSPGSLWMPLYKTGSFSIWASCSASLMYLAPDEKQSYRSFYNSTGSFTMSGTYSITGICSYREAKRLIMMHILKEIYQRTKEQMRTWKE